MVKGRGGWDGGGDGENQFSIPAALRTHKRAFSGRTRESSSADIMMEWDTNSNKYIMGGLFHRSDGKKYRVESLDTGHVIGE